MSMWKVPKSNIHKLIKLEVYGWSLAYQRIVVIFLYLLTYPRLVQSSIRNGMHGARGITSIIQKRPSIQSTKLYAKFANHSTKDQLKLQIQTNCLKKSIYFGWKFRGVCRFLGHSIKPPPQEKRSKKGVGLQESCMTSQFTGRVTIAKHQWLCLQEAPNPWNQYPPTLWHEFLPFTGSGSDRLTGWLGYIGGLYYPVI